MVPLYQRKYQWADERLVPFWDDVEAKAAEVLGGNNRFQHYMGALILAPLGEGSQIGVTPRVQVVDGQQRLTTFQLFLAALREVARTHEFAGIIDQANGYLFNQPRSKDTDPLVRFKLTPTPSDREIFHDIIDIDYPKVRAKYQRFYWGSGVPKNTPFRALRAYDLFRKWISDFALNGPSDAEPDTEDEAVEAADEGTTPEVIEQRLDALLSAVLAQMKLVVITLGEGDDAQVIFETLNSKGEPLLAMDLVRNNIFHRAEKQTTATDELYKELSGQVFYRDTLLSGFGLRVGSRSKVYFAEGQVNRMTRRVTIGRADLFAPEVARKKALAVLGEMAEGRNPNEEKRKETAERVTLATAFERFFEARNKLSPHTVTNYGRTAKLYLKAWRKKPMNQITRQMVLAKHQEIARTRGEVFLPIAMAVFGDGTIRPSPRNRT